MPTGDPVKVPKADESTDTAIYVLSRVAGEGADRNADKGDYYLKDDEHQMVADLCKYYKNVIIVINAGGQVDLSFMDEFSNIKALLVIVQPGMEGGNAFADVISGKVNPSESWWIPGHINMRIIQAQLLFPTITVMWKRSSMRKDFM